MIAPNYFQACKETDRGGVLERVTNIVSEQLGVDKDKITPETSFVTDLGADSLDTVELVMELEEEFDINIPDDAARKSKRGSGGRIHRTKQRLLSRR